MLPDVAEEPLLLHLPPGDGAAVACGQYRAGSARRRVAPKNVTATVTSHGRRRLGLASLTVAVTVTVAPGRAYRPSGPGARPTCGPGPPSFGFLL